METLQVQELADEIYETGVGTITIIESLVSLLLMNGVSETDIRQWFGLTEAEDKMQDAFFDEAELGRRS